ncbi:RecQ family ATP-dependent DNA helicase [Hydrocarboniphaga sp.]|uniref:RecQ family ATP-dependent DNA helicase n=1 Tax=Hydrocarboniphaga sp. TaxID=2033016 RepID=UPI003D0D85C7
MLSTDLDEALTRLGYDSFRPGQREAIDTLLDVGRALLVAPTGGGKSLCYQLPALLLPGTTLVISPLIALMQDQVSALNARGVPATFFASTLSADDARERLAGLERGDYKLIYIAPERLTLPGFRERLRRLGCPLVAVDEAHCISEWGHDFRPEYGQLGELLREMQAPRILACTATATPIVRDEIINRLGLPADTPQLVRGFARPNLALRAAEIGGGRERAARVDAVLAETLFAPGAGRGSAIVYTPTRRLAEEEGARLAAAGWKATVYHAGLSADTRSTAQAAFTRGEAEIVCATNAFGMGIDRGDVRCVVHLGPPGSIEAYYQEVGRAGRDGSDAVGMMCWQQSDLPMRRRLLESPSSFEGTPNADVVEHKWNLFLELIRWADGAACRHDAILRYFGDEAETLHGCGRCDVCQALGNVDEVSSEEASLLARKLLSGVARVQNRYGLKQAVRLLRGETEDRLERDGLTQVATFGLLRERSEAWIQRALSRCVTAGWVGFSGDQHPVVRLTDDGVAVMRGQRIARWLPPSDAVASSSSSPKARGGRAARIAPDEEPLGPIEQLLFESLREVRLELAKSEGVPAYVIAHDRTLRELARMHPRDFDEMRAVPGFGERKLERYAQAFLKVLGR